MNLISKISSAVIAVGTAIKSPFVTTFLKLVAFLSVVVIGLPLAWVHIPIDYRPQNYWDFFNSVMLCYIGWHITVKKVGCWIKSP